MLKGLFHRVGNVLRGRTTLDDDVLEELEEALIQADVSVQLALGLVEELREEGERDHLTTGDELLERLRDHLADKLRAAEAPLNTGTEAPTVFLVVGVNGVGKTTAIAKIAHWYHSHGSKVMLAAGDTFRAAAIEQLEAWADRIGCEVVRHQQGADPGAVVFDAMQAGKGRRANLLIIDTAGRLHTKHNLMEELKKIRRIIERENGRGPDETLLVLDATTGQNALMQARTFREAVDVTGIMMTKLDGTAKGGILMTIYEELGLPIKLVGLGERVENLALFSADDFVQGMFEAPDQVMASTKK
jgi:fused signal recognition particle receptor